MKHILQTAVLATLIAFPAQKATASANFTAEDAQYLQVIWAVGPSLHAAVIYTAGQCNVSPSRAFLLYLQTDPELKALWDDTLLAFGQQLISHTSMAWDSIKDKPIQAIPEIPEQACAKARAALDQNRGVAQ